MDGMFRCSIYSYFWLLSFKAADIIIHFVWCFWEIKSCPLWLRWKFILDKNSNTCSIIHALVHLLLFLYYFLLYIYIYIYTWYLYIHRSHVTALLFLLSQYMYKYIVGLNIHGTHVTAYISTNNVSFFVSDF